MLHRSCNRQHQVTGDVTELKRGRLGLTERGKRASLLHFFKKKKQQQQQQIRWAVFHLSTNHIPVCTAASLLTCRPSAAQLDIHSPILTHKLRISSFGLFSWSGGWGQGSKVLVEIGGGCLTCSRSLVKTFCIPRQPLCFDLVLIDRRQGELADNQLGSLIGHLSRGSHHSVSAPSPLLPARLG